MTASATIKPTHKAIQTYYRTLDEYRGGQITHEGATETAFQQLLSETARPHGWMLVPKLSFKRGGKTIIPDVIAAEVEKVITALALAQFRTHYQDKKISKWDIFYYVYGLLHHPGYREKFADNLKRELPRIPFAPAPSPPTPLPQGERGDIGKSGSVGFWAFSKAGKKLADLHLDYENLEPWPLKWLETDGEPLSYRVEKMKLAKDKTSLKVNESLTLAGIPPKVFEYRLGNRSALDWVIDQYQISEDKRSGITSDPNREDDPEYIVRLVGQVMRVSEETVKIVKSLPAFQ